MFKMSRKMLLKLSTKKEGKKKNPDLLPFLRAVLSIQKKPLSIYVCLSIYGFLFDILKTVIIQQIWNEHGEL